MKLTAQVKLLAAEAQRAALLATMSRVNAACDFASGQAWDARIFSKYDLHALVYSDLRTKFGLSAQVAVRAIAKVADAYKLDKDTPRKFRADAAFACSLDFLLRRVIDTPGM